MDRSAMRTSLESHQYAASKAKTITTEAADWWVGATIGFAVLVTLAWNALLLWLICQLF
jgi:hypothetical protein